MLINKNGENKELSEDMKVIIKNKKIQQKQFK